MAKQPRSEPDEFDADDDESALDNDPDEDDGGGDGDDGSGEDRDDDFADLDDDSDEGGGGGSGEDDGDDDDDDFGDFDLSAFDDDDGDDYDDDDDDDDGGRPIWLNPLAIVSFSLLTLVGALIGWLWFSFDEASYQESIRLDVVESQMPPAPRRPPPPAVQPRREATGDGTGGETGGENQAAARRPPAASGEKPRSARDNAEAEAAAAEKAAAAALARSNTSDVPSASPLPPPPPEEKPLALAATDPALISESLEGPLPVIAPDGRQAWQVYARPYTPPAPETPRIAIVIVGLGLSRTATAAAIQGLPGTVTLAFAPYARELEDWIAKARAAGHEVVLELPMEPFDYPRNDPGPHTLLTTASAEENLGRLEWLLSRFTGYIGVTNTMGGKFTAAEAHMRPVLQSLKERGLLYLDSRASQKSVAAKLAAEIDMPRAVNNRFLDSVASRLAIDARLLELERIALTTGAAVGIGFPYPVTLERIASWHKDLHKKGIVMAPLAALSGQQAIN